jgi:hypothetical protein
MAWLTCSMPAVCSWLADVISAMMSVTRRTLVTISVHGVAGVVDQLRCRRRPCSTESPISP